MQPLYSTKSAAGAALIALLTLSSPLLAETDKPFTTSEDVRSEISEAMEAIADYSDQERDQALAKAREAMNRLDAELNRRGQALRDNWSDLSESARETASERLQDLQEARNALGERYGALQSDAKSTWDNVNTDFSEAWESFSNAWTAADEDAS